MRRLVILALTGTAVALSVLSFAGCKKDADQNREALPVAPKTIAVPQSTTPGGGKLPPGVTVDPSTGAPKSSRPGPPPVENVDPNTVPKSGSASGH